MPYIPFLEQYGSLSDACKTDIQSRFYPIAVKKGQVLLTYGQICKNIYFIESGIARIFYTPEVTDGSREITVWLASSGWLLSSPNSYYNGTPSTEILEILEKGTFWAIEKQDMDYLLATYDELNRPLRILYEHSFQLYERRMALLQEPFASKRYEIFLRLYPHLANRISNKHLSSFLGMTPESLSRIKSSNR
jgi:CRP/FNR family transcriptional regulator, anaerobic regulatory protein